MLWDHFSRPLKILRVKSFKGWILRLRFRLETWLCMLPGDLCVLALQPWWVCYTLGLDVWTTHIGARWWHNLLQMTEQGLCYTACTHTRRLWTLLFSPRLNEALCHKYRHTEHNLYHEWGHNNMMKCKHNRYCHVTLASNQSLKVPQQKMNRLCFLFCGTMLLPTMCVLLSMLDTDVFHRNSLLFSITHGLTMCKWTISC